jgi:hypothetical protein
MATANSTSETHLNQHDIGGISGLSGPTQRAEIPLPNWQYIGEEKNQ